MDPVEAFHSLKGEAFGQLVVSGFDMLQCALFATVTPELKLAISGLPGAKEAASQKTIKLQPTALRHATKCQLLTSITRIRKYTRGNCHVPA